MDPARLAEDGERAFAAGDYERALPLFERAHAGSGRPALLVRVGETEERLGRDDRALEAYREYVRRYPSGAERAEVDERIASLGAEAAGRIPAPAVAATPSAEPAREPRSPVGFFVGAGAAGVTLAVGVAYWLNRDNALEDCTQAIASGSTCSDEDALRRQRNAGIALAAIGGAALPALIVVGVLRARDREPDDADLVFVPSVDPIGRSASLGVSGRF